MNTVTKLVLALSIHFVGGFITLFKYCKDGTMEYAAKHGDGNRWATPSDVVYHSFVLWELELFLFLAFILPDTLINNYFRNKYNGDNTNAK